MFRLQFAAVAGLSDMVQQELRNGADINKADQWGQTPLGYAAEKGHSEIMRMLRAAGAK